MRANTAQNAKHRLHKKRCFDQALVHKVGQVVQVANVVALKLEACLVGVAGLQGELDVLEGVAKNQVAAVFQVFAFPVVFQIGETLQHRKQGKVEGTHVERRHFGRKPHRGLNALVDLHEGRAAAGQVDHRVGAGLDLRQKFGKGLGALVRLAGDGIACMQVDDGRTRLGSPDRRLDDFFGRDRQMGGHGGRVNRPGDGAGDDDFGHAKLSGCSQDTASHNSWHATNPSPARHARKPLAACSKVPKLSPEQQGAGAQTARVHKSPANQGPVTSLNERNAPRLCAAGLNAKTPLMLPRPAKP